MKSMKFFMFLLVIFFAAASPLIATDIAPGNSWGITLQADELQIPLHLASPTEFQTKVTIPSYSDTTIYRDFHYFEEGAPHYTDGFLFNLGMAIPLVRIYPQDNENLGIGITTKFMVPFVTDERWVAMAMEYAIDLGITLTPIEGFSIGMSRKHICSHLTDRSFFTDGENMLGLASSDVDPMHTAMAIRDSIIFSAHIAPDELLGINQDIVDSSIYADYGYSMPGWDPLDDARYTRPSYRTSRYFQYGIQAISYLQFDGKDLGGVYLAGNISHYENSGYTPNYGASVGYILPHTIGKRKIMLDFSYYDGRAVIEEYYGHRERYTSIGLRIM